MSKYSQAIKREPSQEERPKEREMCGVPGCQSRHIPNGKPQRGFADIAFTLDDGTRIARCCYHYDIELYRAGKGRWSDITGRDTDLRQEHLDAHYARQKANGDAA